MLKVLGCKVHVAENGKEALTAMASQRFDVVLMDCQMPVMDGYEATERIRNLEKESGHRTPIIALTAHALQSDRQRCLAAGMDDYITKPVLLHGLRAMLKRWIDGASQPSTPAPSTPDVSEARPSEPGEIDTTALAALRALEGDDPGSMDRLINAFMRTTRDDLALMAKELAAGDLQALKERAHRLKGSCGFMGASHLKEVTESLEAAMQQGQTDDVLTQRVDALDASMNHTFDALKAYADREAKPS